MFPFESIAGVLFYHLPSPPRGTRAAAWLLSHPAGQRDLPSALERLLPAAATSRHCLLSLHPSGVQTAPSRCPQKGFLGTWWGTSFQMLAFHLLVYNPPPWYLWSVSQAEVPGLFPAARGSTWPGFGTPAPHHSPSSPGPQPESTSNPHSPA